MKRQGGGLRRRNVTIGIPGAAEITMNGAPHSLRHPIRGWRAAAVFLLGSCALCHAASVELCPDPGGGTPYGFDSTVCLPNLPPYVGLSWGVVCALASLVFEWWMFSRMEVGKYPPRAVLGQWLRGAGLSVVVFLAFLAYLEMVAFQTALRPLISELDELMHSGPPSIRPFILITLIHLPAVLLFLATKYLTFVHGFGKSVRTTVLKVEINATLIGTLVASAIAALTAWR